MNLTSLYSVDLLLSEMVRLQDEGHCAEAVVSLLAGPDWISDEERKHTPNAIIAIALAIWKTPANREKQVLCNALMHFLGLSLSC